MRNNFLEKSSTKCGGATIKIEYLTIKKSKLSLSLDQNSKVSYSFVFIVCHVKAHRNILKLSCRPLALISYKAFLKSKAGSATSLPATFST